MISGVGGAEISLLEMVGRLRDSFEFHLIVPGEGLLQRRAESAGAKVWLLPWPEALAGAGETAVRPGLGRVWRAAKSVREFSRRLAGVLREIGPAAFVTNAIKAHVLGALTRRPKGVPLIWYMRDGLEERALSRKVLKLLAWRCDLALCISRYVAGQFRQYVSDSGRVEVVHNIVDLKRFRPYYYAPEVGDALARTSKAETTGYTGLHRVAQGVDRTFTRGASYGRDSGSTALLERAEAGPSDLHKPAGEIWFGVVGAITPLKGQDIFLDAAEVVAERLPNSAFVIVGDNPYATEATLNFEQALREKVEGSSRLRGRVKFLGFREDVPEILSRLDVLVQANRGPEGLGRSVLEALACGVPVIAVNQWGPAELIREGETGLLFPPLDVKALGDRMVRLGSDGPLRERMGANGRRWMEKNFVPEDLTAQLAWVLNSAIRPGLNGEAGA